VGGTSSTWYTYHRPSRSSIDHPAVPSRILFMLAVAGPFRLSLFANSIATIAHLLKHDNNNPEGVSTIQFSTVDSIFATVEVIKTVDRSSSKISINTNGISVIMASTLPPLPVAGAHGVSPSTAYSTSSGLLAMLQDPTPEVRNAALQALLKVVDTLWHEVAEALPDLESFAEDDTLDVETRSCAAAVASRVYFHLEENIQALRLALLSGKQYFDVVDKAAKDDPYSNALVSAAIRLYIKYRKVEMKAGSDGTAAAEDADMVDKLLDQDVDEEAAGGGAGSEKLVVDMAELERVVDSMFQRCYADAVYNHALGVALEAHHVTKFKQVLEVARKQASTTEYKDTLSYAVYASVNLVTSKRFRTAALEVVAEEYTNLQKVDAHMDWSALCRVQQLLNKPEQVANIIFSILSKNDDEDSELIGYQLCFDLVDSGDMGFFNRVAAALPPKPEEVDGSSSGAEWDRLDQARRVLTGGFSGELALSFLHKQSDSDPLIMENVKKALDEKGGRNSVLHNCAVVCHAYLNAGTTNDSFLRTHLDWMKKASNW
jgi:26S proteasome regulatory subunit N2